MKKNSIFYFRENVFLWIVLIIVAMGYSFIAIQSHNHFETFGWDLGFFDQIIWKVGRGDFTAYSTIAHENLLADHFQPVLYLLAPLYLLKSDVRVLLVSQAFLVTFAAYPLYLLSKHVTKSVLFSFALVVSYLLFIGTQWTILNEFHQAAFVPLFLSLLFFALEKKRTLLYWISIVGLLATKEELGLLIAPLGVVTSFYYKEKMKGVITTLLGIGMFFALIYIIMPSFSVRGTYSHFDFGEAGYTPLDAAKKSLLDPLFFAKSMVSPSVKIKTLFDSFFAYGGIALLSPIHLIPIFVHFATRFIYAGGQFTKWVNVNHHAAPLGILLSVSTMYSALYLKNILEKHIGKRQWNLFSFLALYILFFAIVQDIYLHGPIHSLVKPQLYDRELWMENIYDIIQRVPPDSSVAAGNNLVPHLSQRNEIFLLPEIGNAQYIVIDFHDNPNVFSPLTRTQMHVCFADLIQNKNFSVVYQKGDVYLLKRNENFDKNNNQSEVYKYEI